MYAQVLCRNQRAHPALTFAGPGTAASQVEGTLYWRCDWLTCLQTMCPDQGKWTAEVGVAAAG